jgi:cell division septation protein DedD
MDVYQRRRLVALSVIAGVFILFVLLIRGCGGNDDQSTEPLSVGTTGASGAAGVTSLAQPDYIAQADPICLEANTSLDHVDEADAAKADSQKSQIVAGELQQLQTLPPPDGATDKLDKFLSSLQKQSLAYKDRSTAQDRGDTAAVSELTTTLEGLQAKAATDAKTFGFKVCGDLGKTGSVNTVGGTGSGGAASTTATGGTVTPSTPAAPATTTPVPAAPAGTDAGTVTPTPAAPAPAPTDGTAGSSSSGGVSP